MALWLKSDGTTVEVEPLNGKTFSLDELQEYVGGHIELFTVMSPTLYSPLLKQFFSMKERRFYMVLNEEGKLLGLPLNTDATMLAIDWLYKGDYICGDVLICNINQID